MPVWVPSEALLSGEQKDAVVRVFTDELHALLLPYEGMRVSVGIGATAPYLLHEALGPAGASAAEAAIRVEQKGVMRGGAGRQARWLSTTAAWGLGF